MKSKPRPKFKHWTLCLLNLIVSFSLILAAWPAGTRAAPGSAPVVQGPALTQPRVSRPVRPLNTQGLPPAPTVDPTAAQPREMPGGRVIPLREPQPGGPAHDPVVQRQPDAPNMPPTLQNFAGQSAAGHAPPDTNGAVGPNHYVQMVNVTTAIYDKAGNRLYGPFEPNMLWPADTQCGDRNDGDPVVLYDHLADRWLLTQFAVEDPGPYYQCIAVSKTGTPTNDPDDWYPYEFEVHPSKMNDYPKIGVWPDGYYMSANQFVQGNDWGGAGVWVFEREKMLDGEAATFQYFDLWEMDPNYAGLLPGNLMGNNLPPDGALNHFVSADIAYNLLHLFAFRVDWENPGNSTFTLVKDLTVAPFDGNLCNRARSCIPQPDTSNGVDALGGRLMMHLWYRNFGSHEVLVTNHTVDVGEDHAGVRWYEIRDPGPSAYVYQQGTFAPDQHHRWMGSIAMDRVGNIALGYSISSETLYPSIRYTGQLAGDGDQLGIMTQGEGTIIDGSGSQTDPSRWGDYSSMSVDPVDDCTFWYTQEYIATLDSWNWRTRIASFQFPSCLAATGALTGTVTSSAGGSPIGHARVTARTNPTYVAFSRADGHYGFSAIPTGTYSVTFEAYGYQPETINGLSVTQDATTRQDAQLAPLPTFVVSGTVTDTHTGWPLYARIDVQGYPGSPLWTDPLGGHYSATLAGDTPYTFTVSAWTPGYQVTERAVGPLTGDATEEFALLAARGACIAPGYRPSATAYAQDFESDDGGYTHAGDADEWEWGTPSSWPAGCASDDNCWGTDLSGDYNADSDQTLTSPLLDLSTYPTGTILTAHWWQAWDMELGFDYAFAEVSVDGGPWTEMWSGSDRSGWTPMSYDLSAAAEGNVQFRWRMTSDGGVQNAGYYLDDVRVTVGCESSSGGLVVGQVYDGQTGAPLTGAQVNNESGEAEVTRPTIDPGVDDGFYQLFAPTGTHAFTATLAPYGTVTTDVVVIKGGTVRQDFYLPSAVLTYAPSGYDVPLVTGEAVTHSLTLSNAGAIPLEWDITEEPGDLPWLRVSPASGTTAPGDDAAISVAFDATGLVSGLYTGSLRLASNDPSRPTAHVPVTLTVDSAVPQWEQQLYISKAPLDAAPYPVLSGDEVKIVERVNISFAGDVAFTLVEEWTDSLALADVALPAGSLLLPGVDLVTATHAMTWTVTDLPGDWGYVLTKTFDVTGGDWLYDYVTATLTVRDAQPQLPPRTLDFIHRRYDVALTPPTDARSGAPGTPVTYTLTLQNLGTVADSFDVALDGNAWPSVASTETVGPLNAHQTGTLQLYVTIPTTATSGASDAVDVTVTSTHAPDRSASGNLTTTAVISAVYDVALTPSTDARSGAPGTSVTYTLTLQNLGTVTDSFGVGLGGNAWPAMASTDNIGPLNANQTGTLQLYVTIPTTATSGASDTVDVTVTSIHAPDRSARSSLTTTVRAGKIYLPLVLRDH